MEKTAKPQPQPNKVYLSPQIGGRWIKAKPTLEQLDNR